MSEQTAPAPATSVGEMKIHDLTAYKVIVAGSLMTRRATAHFRQYLNITMWEARILGWLGSYPDMSLKELAVHTRLDKGQLSRVVSELTARGLVERKTLGRSISLSLSEAGRAEYRKFVELTTAHEAEYTEDFSPEELAVLRDCLDRLIIRMTRINSDESLPND